MNRQAQTEFRMVPDPVMSDAEFYHQRHENPNKPNIGKVQVAVNMRALIGGYCNYKNRSDAQTMAAARFKSLHEASQIANLQAVDLESPLVDTSFKPTTLSMEHGAMARKLYGDVIRAIGCRAAMLIERVVVHDMSQRRIARGFGYGAGGKGFRAVTSAVDDAMNALVVHFHY